MELYLKSQALVLAHEKADYILSVYAPLNENNINASPNKIYDAIQTETPVIINAEVKISDWVRTKRIGFILPKYEVNNYTAIVRGASESKKNFHLRTEVERNISPGKMKKKNF